MNINFPLSKLLFLLVTFSFKYPGTEHTGMWLGCLPAIKDNIGVFISLLQKRFTEFLHWKQLWGLQKYVHHKSQSYIITDNYTCIPLELPGFLFKNSKFISM